VKLFAQKLAKDRDGERPIISSTTARLCQDCTKRGVDHGLISGALRLSLTAEKLDDVVVEHDRDSGLTWGSNNCAPLPLGEIVFLTHDIEPLRFD
jgi:hypothetical protein